jgi:integrase
MYTVQVSLTLYRRHGKACDVLKSSLPAKAKRLLLDACQCPLWLYGNTAKGLYPRQSTHLTDLKEAEALLRSLDAEAKDETVHGPKISDCIQSYLASREHELSTHALEQYRLQLGRLEKYCSQRAVFHMHGLNADLLESFKVDGLPKMANTSKATAVAKLRCFLREAYRRDWTIVALVDKTKPFHAAYETKQPFTEEEISKILDEAGRLNGSRSGYTKRPGTLRLLLELMLETGMRVGDSILFDPKSCVKGECLWCYTFFPQKRKKTDKPKPHEVFLTDALKDAIENCQWLSKERPFHYGASSETEALYYQIYAAMQNIGKRCGINDCRPHRLRDTFAVRRLLGGLEVQDVSRLLGHSSVTVTEQHYAPWIAARKLRLERLLAQSFMHPTDNRSRDA